MRPRARRVGARFAGEAGGIETDPSPPDVAEAPLGAARPYLARRSTSARAAAESGAISKVMQLLPRAGREGVARLLKADRVLAGADPAARASYEERASHSEPALESEAGEPAKTASK